MIDAVDLTRCRVLLVDDIESSLDVLVETLRGQHLLSVALDGATALKSIRRSPPDLVLLDLMMPRLDGYEVCRQLRADPLTRDLPVIFISALGEAKSKARGFEAGGTDYISKPFDAIEVRARVRSLLKAKMYQDTVRASLAGELRMAQEIQRSIVRKEFAGFLQMRLDVHAILEPAKEVGGDLYDVFPVGDGKVCIVIGDVSGKGVAAALFMAITATLLRSTARHLQRPEQIIACVNDELASANEAQMFVTLFCAVLDTKSGMLAYANAGHLQPVLIRRGEAAQILPVPDGRSDPVAGLQNNTTYTARELQLHPGDALFLYTDGATEAFNPTRDVFGETRLLQTLSQLAENSPAKDMTGQVLASVREFALGESQSDDIALLAFRWRPD